jgi:hypothetical protein
VHAQSRNEQAGWGILRREFGLQLRHLRRRHPGVYFRSRSRQSRRRQLRRKHRLPIGEVQRRYRSVHSKMIKARHAFIGKARSTSPALRDRLPGRTM